MNEKICCSFMEEQLNHTCDVHGDGWLCPDVLIERARFQFGEGEIILIARNAEYTCNFCPVCGTKWPGAKDRQDRDRHWGKPIE